LKKVSQMKQSTKQLIKINPRKIVKQLKKSINQYPKINKLRKSYIKKFIQKVILINQRKIPTIIKNKLQSPLTTTTTMRMKPLRKLRIPRLRPSHSVIKVLSKAIKVIKFNTKMILKLISQYSTKISRLKINRKTQIHLNLNQ
jgi:hypothetical protein